MSEAEDRESKTEEPSQRKLDEAESKGNVPFSREVPHFASILGILLVSYLVLGHATVALTAFLASVFDNAGSWRLDDLAGANDLFLQTASATAKAILPVLLVIAAAGLAGSLIQNAPSISAERIRPELSKISPGKGWRRIFGWNGQAEFIKSALKLSVTLAVMIFAGMAEVPRIIESMITDPGLLPHTILAVCIRLATVAALVVAVLAAADFALSRFTWRRNLRMTRHELKEDVKQSEGDPFVKQRIRSLARRKASRRMMAAVPKATLVVTNPTHISVALRYAREDGGAPVVVAKGADYLAMRIREIAQRHNVPIMENKDLARALHDKVEVGTMIPPEFYRAVAELIHVLNSHKPANSLA
jgi:flagellar biosynthetic protein FlhB